jgi:hypothetical protein
MSNEERHTHDPQVPQQPLPHDQQEIREGAWQVIQQGAQVFAEVGGGAAGFATAAHLGRRLFDGSGSSGDAGPPPQDNTPSGSTGTD